MKVAANIKNSVCFLGTEEHGKFVPKATAFFVGVRAKYEGSFIYLVTAEHVLVGLQQNGQKVVSTRMNSSPGVPSLPFELPIAEWFFHPNSERTPTDVAVLPVTVGNTDPNNFVAFDADAFVTRENFHNQEWGVGDEVVVIGLFRNHHGKERNIPLVRIGNLAALPEEPVKTNWGYLDAYLVELHSVGGLSGSPCYIHRALTRVKDGKLQYIKNQQPLSLLGLVSGHFDVPNLREDAVQENQNGDGNINAGIAVVVPAYKILETLNQDELVTIRKKISGELADARRGTTGRVT